MTTLTAKRYAQAIFELAQERKDLETWESDLDKIGNTFSDSDFRAFLAAPQVSIDSKLKGIETLLSEVSPLARNFAGLLTVRGHSDLFPDIRERFMEMTDEARRIARCQIFTAVPFQAKQREVLYRKLLEMTQADKIVLSEIIDPSLVGGFRVRISDSLIDGSVKTKLRNLEDKLAKTGVLSNVEE